MVPRQVNRRDWYAFQAHENAIARNYFPVTSAVAMRDKAGGKLQVTIMNDRSQGGSADLSDKATIELMQNRRQVQPDPKFGLDEALNDTEPVSATYMMQIFDT